MSDLLQSQIQESCRLALPEGLKDLMCDISREVLRAQPKNLLEFIADYLSALLVTRENLSIASRVCTDIYSCGCQPELECELRNIGVYDEDVEDVTEIILKHFYNDEVHEASILMKLLKRIDIEEDQLVKVQEAIRNAFMRHQANHTTIYESSSESDKDEIDVAVRHTLKVYRKTKPSQAEFEAMEKKIQASYHAYGVRRYCQTKHHQVQEQGGTGKNVKVVLPAVSSSNMVVYEKVDIRNSSGVSRTINNVSSTSLAGSYMHLPRYRPYSAHDTDALSDLPETPEREHAHMDYTAEHPHISIVADKPLLRERKISFEDNDSDSVSEVISYDENICDDDVLKEEPVDEEIVVTYKEIEDSDINDENVVAIDLDVDNVDETLAGDDESVKSDGNVRGSRDDDNRGLGPKIGDDMVEYVMNLSFEAVEDDSGNEL